jgi:hypothetical protein
MSTTNKDAVIVEALLGIEDLLREMSHQIMSTQSFLQENFRNYHPYSINSWGALDKIHRSIEEIRLLSLSNKDNAHRLERHYDEPKDDRVRFVEGDYPQNHSIKEAQKRVGEYPMDSVGGIPGF